MKIIFQPLAAKKIKAYIAATEGEISGLGIASIDNDEILVRDVGIWKQECTSGESEVRSNNDTIQLAEEFIKAGAKPEEVCVWWHSHAKMAAFFSGTDETTMKNWINNRFLVSVVGNKAGEFTGRIKIKQPIPCQISKVEVEFENEDYPPHILKLIDDFEVKNAEKDKKIIEAINEEVLEKVIERVYVLNDKENHSQDHYYPSKRQLKASKQATKEQDWAELCLCDECWEFRAGRLDKFPYKTHRYSQTLQYWIPTNFEQLQLAESRKIEDDNFPPQNPYGNLH